MAYFTLTMLQIISPECSHN